MYKFSLWACLDVRRLTCPESHPAVNNDKTQSPNRSQAQSVSSAHPTPSPCHSATNQGSPHSQSVPTSRRPTFSFARHRIQISAGVDSSMCIRSDVDFSMPFLSDPKNSIRIRSAEKICSKPSSALDRAAWKRAGRRGLAWIGGQAAASRCRQNDVVYPGRRDRNVWKQPSGLRPARTASAGPGIHLSKNGRLSSRREASLSEKRSMPPHQACWSWRCSTSERLTGDRFGAIARIT